MTKRSEQRLFLTVVGLLAVLLAMQMAHGQQPQAKPAGPVLALEGFLTQVREKHGQYKAQEISYRASQMYAREAHLLLGPNLFATIQHSDDQKPPTTFGATRTYVNSYELGVSQQTSFGLSGKLSYTYLDQQLMNMSFGTGVGVDQHYGQAAPKLELSMPLWRNWLGQETNQQIEQGDAAAASKNASARYQMQSVLIQAEGAYWTLALARESVTVAQDAVDRALRLEVYHEKRASMGLDDRSDLLQSQAALQSRKVELRTAQDTERAAARAFNIARGEDSSEVKESLIPLSSDEIHNLPLPKRATNRADVQAALEQARAAKAGAELSRQKYTPTLELFGAASLNNRNPSEYERAPSDAFNGEKPTTAIGVRLNAPLDLGLIRQVRQGYEAEKSASEYTAQRKLLEQESDWNDLQEKYQQAQDRFTLYQNLEKAQKTKLDYERSRLNAGRTTTQQVINFEQDYQQAQLGRIRTMSELLQLLAQMKFYEEVANESR